VLDDSGGVTDDCAVAAGSGDGVALLELAPGSGDTVVGVGFCGNVVGDAWLVLDVSVLARQICEMPRAPVAITPTMATPTAHLAQNRVLSLLAKVFFPIPITS
jgi:hypothetical protein